MQQLSSYTAEITIADINPMVRIWVIMQTYIAYIYTSLFTVQVETKIHTYLTSN